MTVSTLVKVSDQLLNDLKQVQIEIDQVAQKKLNEYNKLIHEYFEEVLEEGDEIKVLGYKIEFNRPQEGYNYLKELMSIRIDTEHWDDEEKNKITTSFYSTSESSDYELRRMILLGKVGQIVLDFKDDILAGWNEIRNRYKEQLRTLSSSRFTIEKERSNISDQIRDIKANQVLDKLESEGIEFDMPKSGNVNDLPNIEVKFNEVINNVKSIHIIKKSTSGKTADVKLTVMRVVWNNEIENNETVQQEILVDKVRMKNIQQFLRYNSEKISAS